MQPPLHLHPLLALQLWLIQELEGEETFPRRPHSENQQFTNKMVAICFECIVAWVSPGKVSSGDLEI